MISMFRNLMLMGLLACCSTALSAQINLKKAKDLVKDKQEETKSTEKPAAEKPATPPASTNRETPRKDAPPPVVEGTPQDRQAGRSRTGSGSKNSTVELDFSSQPFPPAVLWASLLAEGCWYFNITTGEMRVNNMLVSFLPKKTMSGEDVRYESYHNPVPLLRVEIVDAATNTIRETFHYSGKEATLPFYEMELLEGAGYKSYVKLTEGSYELRFFAGAKQYYTFPFRVEKQQNPDPYAPVHDFYFLKGPWEDWGRVEFGPDGHFMFSFYFTDESTTIPNQARWDVSKEWKGQIKLQRDGKTVAVYRLQNIENELEDLTLQTHNGKWIRFEQTMHSYPPAAKGNGAGSRAFFMKNDMKDGNYTAEVTLKSADGKTAAMKYAFTVKNGVIESAVKADRAKNTDPLQFMEQGPGRFFIKKI